MEIKTDIEIAQEASPLNIICHIIYAPPEIDGA